MWSVLFLTLPTQPSAVRLRVWRALKTLGCGSLRDGVYVANDAPWHTPELAGDLYILDASEAWLSQFDGDWQACADQLNPLLAAHSTDEQEN